MSLVLLYYARLASSARSVSQSVAPCPQGTREVGGEIWGTPPIPPAGGGAPCIPAHRGQGKLGEIWGTPPLPPAGGGAPCIPAHMAQEIVSHDTALHFLTAQPAQGIRWR